MRPRVGRRRSARAPPLGSGGEALQFIAAERQPFHLLVTDVVMPSIGGVSLARHLRERSLPPPVLFVSGYSAHAATELADYGELLAKPFTPSQLLAAVTRILDGAADPLATQR